MLSAIRFNPSATYSRTSALGGTVIRFSLSKTLKAEIESAFIGRKRGCCWPPGRRLAKSVSRLYTVEVRHDSRIRYAIEDMK